MNTSPSPDPRHPDLDHEALDRFVRRDQVRSPVEQAKWQAWFDADASHRAAFDRWQDDWQALDQLPSDGVQALRAQLMADLAAPARQAARPDRSARAPWWRRMAALVPQAAMAVMVASVCGGGYLAWDHWQRQPVYTHSFATARGQQLDVRLPDGSLLRLDTATRADVALYRQRREVRLPQGQAVFQVQGDAARPFDVLAGAVRITVVGTRFSVRHTPGVLGQEGVRVAVDQGRVRVARAADEAATTLPPGAIELIAGQQVAGDAGGHLGPVAGVARAGIAPWGDGRVFFDNTPLAEALSEFERYGATGLTVTDPHVAALRLTGTFNPRRLDNFRRVLPRVLPVQLRTRGELTEIVSSTR